MFDSLHPHQRALRSASARRYPAALALVSILAGCSDHSQPLALASSGTQTKAASVVAQAAIGEGTHAYPLTAIAGEGKGHVNITPEASQEGFSVEVQVSLQWTEPNADFLLTRSVDFVPDGVCTGTTFTPLPLPNPGPLELLRTSPAGAGAKHASFAFPPPPPAPFEDGKQFDVHWEIRTANGSTVLRSPCITVTVR